MGLYDNPDAVGAEAAAEERVRMYRERLRALAIRMDECEALIVGDATPHARSERMAELLVAVEPDAADGPAEIAALRTRVAVVRATEVAEARVRRLAELALLEDHATRRIAEVAAGRSLRSVAVAHLGGFADRFAELADRHGLDAARALATAASRAATEAPLEPRGDWAQLEAAFTLWLADTWHEQLLHLEPEGDAITAELANVPVRTLTAGALVLAGSPERSARAYRLRLGLVRGDAGWLVTNVGVLAKFT